MTTETRTAGAWGAWTRWGTILPRVIAFVQRHPAWAIFLLALVLRVSVAVIIAIVNPQNIAPDGIQYSQMAAQKATGHTAGWDAYHRQLSVSVAALLLPLTALYEVFGIHQLVGQLFVALLGAGAAALAARLAMEILPRRWALVVGLIVALLPSQIIWSSLILKDAAVWITLVGLALTIAIAGRSDRIKLLWLGLVAAALLVLLGYLRSQTLIIAVWALMLAALVGPRRNWALRVAGAVTMGVLIPWIVFSLGPAGITYVRGAPPPSRLRVGMAEGAHTVIPGAVPAGVTVPGTAPPRATVPRHTSTAPGSHPSRSAPAPSAQPSGSALPPSVKPSRAAPTTTGKSVGPTATPPAPATTPSSPSPASEPQPDELTVDVHHLPQGILAMLLEPYPWESGGSTYLNLARVQALVWYPLLLLGLIGLLGLRPRHLRVMAFPLLAGGAILLLYALAEGNLGTAFRHRGEFEWVVAMLAGLGLWRIYLWRARSRTRSRGDMAVGEAAGP